MFDQAKLSVKFAIAGIALVVPTALLVVTGRNEAEELFTQRGEFAEAKAQKVIEIIDRNLFERYGDVQAFTFNGTAHDTSQWYKKESKLVDAIDAYVDAYDFYAISVIVDLDGKVVAVNTKDEEGKAIDSSSVWTQSFKGEKWFADALSERFTTSARFAPPENSKASGTVVVDVHANKLLKEVYGDRELAVGFAAPIRDEQGKPIAVWYNLLDFSKLQTILVDEYNDTAKDLPGTHFVLFNGGGQVIANYDPTGGLSKSDASSLEKMSESERQAGSAKRALAGEQGFMLESLPGEKEEVMSGFAHSTGAMGFPGLDWSLVVRNDRSELLAVADRSSHWVWISSIVSLLGLAGVAAFVVRSVSRPLTVMTAAAKRLSEGDVTVAVDHRGGDEIGQLADALRGVMDWVQGVSRAAESISRGDLSQAIHKRSSVDTLSESFLRAQGAIVAVDKDSNRLIDAVRSGQLDVRADAAKHEGAFAKLIEGLNRMVATAAEPIGEAKSVLSSVANRDLSRRMQGHYQGDWETIKTSLNQAIDNLDESLGQVTVAADQVTTAATEITIGNQSLAQIATEQASSLDSVTNRLQEVTTAGQQTAGNAQQARGMANAANDAAERGAQNMSGLSQAIEQIKSASDRTAQIVKTIDEIAFQTNLLALNAAVEAARAGDAGKGFAVVAEEVRNLAMRSADAARSTSQMIEDAVKSAERGVNLNASVAKNFTEIRSQVGRVVEVMAEIAAAAETQAQGVVDINHMVTELSKATQQNAATTEESASAAEELSGQAESLKDLVGTFQLQNGAQGHAPPRRQGRAAARLQPQRMPATTHKAPIRVNHLRSVPPPPKQAASVSRGAQLIPFDDSDGNTALAEF